MLRGVRVSRAAVCVEGERVGRVRDGLVRPRASSAVHDERARERASFVRVLFVRVLRAALFAGGEFVFGRRVDVASVVVWACPPVGCVRAVCVCTSVGSSVVAGRACLASGVWLVRVERCMRPASLRSPAIVSLGALRWARVLVRVRFGLALALLQLRSLLCAVALPVVFVAVWAIGSCFFGCFPVRCPVSWCSGVRARALCCVSRGVACVAV